jgi:tRNA A-37 threonylcarbamoyl transferase component Bud32
MMEYKLIVEAGSHVGKEVRLNGSEPTLIGRAADTHFRIEHRDHRVSRHHVSLDVVPTGVLVRDLKSRNGTFMNGARVATTLMLPGDRLQVGSTVFSLHGRVAVEGPSEFDEETCTDFFDDSSYAPRSGSAGGCVECHEGIRPVSCTRFLDAAWMCEKCGTARAAAAPKRAQIGGFDLLLTAGEGASAVVFEARHRATGARVALKRLRIGNHDRTTVRRFMREQRIAMSFVHPRVVRCYEAGEDSAAEALYIAMEWLPYGDASKMVFGTESFNQVISLGADLFEALAYIHALGIVHRDVKPQNLLLSSDGGRELRGKLADFGIIKSLREPGSITREQQVTGTPLFMAPEQITDFKKTGPQADIYAAAATLYFMLTRSTPLVLPTDSHAPMMALVATLDASRVSLAERWPGAPQPLVEWMDCAVSADPAARANMSAGEIADRLRRMARGRWRG